MNKPPPTHDVEIPAGGWGSAKATLSIFQQEHASLAAGKAILKQNKQEGFTCVSCSWAKPAHPHSIEACENGIKATAWELTSKRNTPEFFAAHSVTELLSWSDLELEDEGRLTEPLRWDATSDKYVPVSWNDAFADIGTRLQKLAPETVVFYTSGRASLEASFLYQLFARVYGTNNLPDSSNMCHESTSVALPQTIGVGIGTVDLDDFKHTDCIFFFGQNVGTNSPRMLHQLQEARERDVPIITFNPLRERGLVSFRNPLSVSQMALGLETQISTRYNQVRVGGDIAAVTGICKALLAADDQAMGSGAPRVLDVEFIDEHTHGLDEFRQYVSSCAWEQIETESGLPRVALEDAANEYARANRVMAIYGMGLTQHRRGVEAVQMLTNLLLLRGNIGKPGAGICPVRGHSNVQGQRTVGITEKPELAPLDKLEERYGFKAPRDKGLNTVETCQGVIAGSVKAFIGLGGNFVRAVPDTDCIEAGWRGLELTVQIATKLNRSHLVHGRVAYLLPCLGRIEIDRQLSGEQSVTTEDSTGVMHPSSGVAAPASEHLLSETAIVAGLAKATLPANAALPWEHWVADYSRIRDEIAAIYAEIFHDFNERRESQGGFRRPMPAAQRVWKTKNGKANFIAPEGLVEDPDVAQSDDPDVLRLMTMRSDDQFNTTVYTLNDRFRGVEGTRRVIFMNPTDFLQFGFADGDMVSVFTAVSDGVQRVVKDMRLTAYDIPKGCLAGYYPECNPLIPLWHHAKSSFVPAAKSIPVRLVKSVSS
ncbi:MAG: FdhF/YdeP family oxidoreductase [Proteobacteria bacterium]|nr:FdhF/YdeP family oxidoreductase [Pseudomonadota bacterium]